MRRWLLVIGLSVVALLALTFVVLRVKFEGEDLGSNLASLLNKRMRGRIEIGSVEWQSRDLKKVVTGGWVPIVIKDVKVWDDCALSQIVGDAEEVRAGDPNEDCTPDERPDPDPHSKRKPRKQLLRAPLLTVELDVHALLFGNHDFVFRNLWIYDAQALIEETREPYPLHAYDKTSVTIITAFYPRMAAGFRAGIYADSPPPVFDLRDIHIRNLDLYANFKPFEPDATPPSGDQIGFALSAHLEHVNIDADPDKLGNDSFFYMDPTDPLVAKMYVRLAVAAPRGRLRILDQGPRTAFRMPPRAQDVTADYAKERIAKYDLGLVDVNLNRLAQLPTEWPRHDFVANSLELDLSAKTTPCMLAPGQPPDGVLIPRYDAKPSELGGLHLTGELQSYFDRPYDGAWNLKLAAQNLGPTIHGCINQSISGDDLKGTISLTGPFVASPKVGLDLENVDFALNLSADQEPLRLTLAEVHGGIDLVNEQGFIDKTKALINSGKEPGEVELSATFGISPFIANAQIEITKAIDAGRFLPPRAVAAAGKFLKGRLRAKGDTTPGEGFALEDFDLSLGATPTSTSLRVHKGRLFTDNNFGKIQIESVAIDAGQSHAVVDGYVDPEHRMYDLAINGSFPDIGLWLQRFGLPQFVSGAGGGGTSIRIKGTFDNPTVTVSTSLSGVPCLDKLTSVEATYQGEYIDISKAVTSGLGGQLTISGRINKNSTGAAPIIEHLQATGRNIDASRLCGLAGIAKGTLTVVDATIDKAPIIATREPMDWLDYMKVYARAPKLSIKGDAYSDVNVCINRADDAPCRPRPMTATKEDLDKCATAKRTGGSCIVATGVRDLGGVLDATIAKLPPQRATKGAAAQPASLAGGVSVDLPLAILEQFLGKRIVGGDARMTLHLSGPPDAPKVDGYLTLLRTWLYGAFVGDSQLRVEPTTLANGKAAVRIHGKLLGDRLGIDGTLGTTAPFPVEMKVEARRIEIDQFVDITTVLGLPEPTQAFVSGTVTVKTQLAPIKPIEPEAWVELSEVTATVSHRASDGRITPLRLTVVDQTPGGRPALSLRVTPTSVEFACKDVTAPGGKTPCSTEIATPAGTIQLEGFANEKAVAVSAKGELDLSLIQPLFDSRFDEASGRLALSAAVTGTLAKPLYEASLELDTKNPVRLRPAGGDTVLEAAHGLIKLANGSLGFTDVVFQVRDQHLDEQGELHVRGNITLAGLTPDNWSVLVSGKVAGKMLLVAVPGAVSQAGGLATIDGDLILSGRGLRPLISGSVSFKPEGKQRPLSLIPRGVRREISLNDGSIDIETAIGNGDHRSYTLTSDGIRASIDGEGTLSNIDGKIVLTDTELSSLDVRMDADKIPFKIPGVLELVLTGRDIEIEKPAGLDALDVRGSLAIVDGEYKANFELADQIKAIGSNAPPSRPFWDEYPLIGNADLNLTLDVRSFRVKNNIAKIDLVGPLLEITNTPRDPRLSGSIRVERGEFKIPGTRANFTRTSGTIDFAENQKAGDPLLNVTSEAPDYRDLSGQEHLITLTITGQLSNPQWDLKTSTGYNKSQTLSLLVLGRNQEQLRRSLSDQSLGGDPTKQDPTTNPSQGVADQIVKDLAGDWVSNLLGDNLTRLTGLDVLRIEIGFGSIGVRVEKKLLENFRAIADGEQTIRGSTINVRGEIKTPFKLRPRDGGLSLQGGILRKNFYDPAEQDIDDKSVKLVYRYIFIP